MASLTDKTIGSTYKDLLQVSNSNSGVDSTTRSVSDGEGTDSALQISSSTVNINGTFKISGNEFARSGAHSLTFTTTATTALTLPTTGTVSTLAGSETFTNKTLTSPTINGGTATALTGLAIRSTGAAFDLTFANTEVLTAGRTLTITLNDAARTLNLAGNLTTAAAFITSGANSLTLTTTGSTDVTLPTTGILATRAGTETFTNKTLTSPAINTATIEGGTIGTTTAATICNVDNLRLDGNTLSTTNTNGNLVLAPNGTGMVTGTAWEKISTATASASASVAFTSLTSTYIAYKVIMTNVAPATDATVLMLRTSTDNGSTYDAGAANYSYQHVSIQGATGSDVGNDSTQIQLGLSVGNAANELIEGEVTILNPSAAVYTRVLFHTSAHNAATLSTLNVGQGVRVSAADVDAIQFLFSSGNIATGTFTLYGIRA